MDALTASGLRALWVRKEIPDHLIESVTGIDMSSKAVKIFQENLKLNSLENDSKIKIIQNDSVVEMFNTSK